MISLSCFACKNGLHCVVKSAINRDSGDFHSDGLPSQFDFCTLLACIQTDPYDDTSVSRKESILQLVSDF